MPINPHLRIAPYHSEAFLMGVNSWVLRCSAIPEICIISVFSSLIVYILKWVFLGDNETSIKSLMLIYDDYHCQFCLVIISSHVFSFLYFSQEHNA